jgi:hypothetical protein
VRTDSLSNEVAFLAENPDLMAQYVAALERVRRFQPERMAWFREQGVVFDKAPAGAPLSVDDRDYWQQIAFALYTDLCEIESIAARVLSD